MTYDEVDEMIRDATVSLLSEMKRNLERFHVPNQHVRAAIVTTAANLSGNDYDYVLEKVYGPLPQYFMCENRICTDFHKVRPIARCSLCEQPAKQVPDAVVKAMARKFDRQGLTSAMMKELRYDALNKCYYFIHADMYHGVEPDGYIHT